MKTLFALIVTLLLGWGVAFAAVDINSADEKGLDAVKGIGAVKARAIVEERKKNGPFKDLDDVARRVKGIGDKTVADWKKSGDVTVGTGARSAASAPASRPAAPAPAQSAAKAAPAKEAPKAAPASTGPAKDIPRASTPAPGKETPKAAAAKDGAKPSAVAAEKAADKSAKDKAGKTGKDDRKPGADSAKDGGKQEKK